MIIFRAIKPSRAFQSSVFRDEMKKEMESLAKDVQQDFERTTSTWKHRVKFSKKVSAGASAGGISIEVNTKDKIYGYVDEGTKPHVIKAKRGKRLAFSSKFVPKTESNVILSVPGSKGKVDTFRKQVHHPGTEARHFSKVIAKSFKPQFKKAIKNALERAARRSGYLYGGK